MATNTFNVGIIGYGLSARIFHIPLISVASELNLYAIVQRSPKPNDDAEEDHPGIKSYRSSEDLVKDDTVDVVVITTPPETHFDLAKLALESGKHGMYLGTTLSFPSRTHDCQWSLRNPSLLPPLRHESWSRLPKSVASFSPFIRVRLPTRNTRSELTKLQTEGGTRISSPSQKSSRKARSAESSSLRPTLTGTDRYWHKGDGRRNTGLGLELSTTSEFI